MTSEQTIRIASRTFAAYLLFWVVADATYLPREVMSLVHAIQGSQSARVSVLNPVEVSYAVRLYTIYLAENILRIVLWLMAAGWFYRCGPRVQRFFDDSGAPAAEHQP